jgi:hypothetical protein
MPPDFVALDDYSLGVLLAHAAWVNAIEKSPDFHALGERLARTSRGFYGPAGIEKLIESHHEEGGGHQSVKAA